MWSSMVSGVMGMESVVGDGVRERADAEVDWWAGDA